MFAERCPIRSVIIVYLDSISPTVYRLSEIVRNSKKKEKKANTI